MMTTVALARAELVMLTRNRTALVNAVLVPFALGILWIVSDPPGKFASFGAVLQLLVLIAFTILSVATTTLVARRGQHVLERWRLSTATNTAILAGTLTPALVLFTGQATLLLAMTAYATGSAPDRPLVLGIAVVLGGAFGCALACVTAACTRTVEATSVTLLPATTAVIGGGIWATTTAPGELDWWVPATGGGAIAGIVRIGWDGAPDGAGLGGAIGAALPHAAWLLALTAVATAIAAHSFRWHGRA
ncbi:hypothetical protein [Haloechinothrix salitolerans]|uniref:ABC-2 type transport system permease protein n=1 Tax=Haloechinothrix salitolerans TaxID=926830 RepID=A0ABW2C2W9_9PSEU